jgi:hypothetical protein
MVVKMVVKPIAKLSEEARSSPSRTHLHPLPGLTPDPNRRHRLEEIRDNLRQDRRKPNQKAGWAKSKDCKSASPTPKTS